VGLPSSEPPYAWWADFDKSGVVDYGDLSFLVANFGKSRAGGQAITFPTNFPTAWARAPQAGPGDALRGDAALDQASAGAALLTPEVNGDGRVTPLDALILINAIHVRSASSQSNVASPLNLQPPYLDPNLDGYLTAADVLTVINYLNGTGSSLAGESEPPEPTDRTASGLAEVAPAVRLKGAAGSSESGEASARVGTSSVGDWQQAKNDPSPPPSPRSTGARELSLRSDAGGDAAADAPQDPLFAGLLRELAPLEDVLSELARDIASARCRRGA
jgi:hypothetical protein